MRVWLIGALVTALVVAASLLGAPASHAPAALSAHEVRLCIDVMPRIQSILDASAAKFQTAYAKGAVDAQDLGMQAQVQVAALLARYGLTLEGWTELSERVGEAVRAAR